MASFVVFPRVGRLPNLRSHNFFDYNYIRVASSVVAFYVVIVLEFWMGESLAELFDGMVLS